MTRQLFRLYLFLLVCFSISVTATAQTVDIPDPNLRAVIEKELGKASGDTITADDMATLTQLAARNVDIRVLTGLEAATNLTELLLGFNSIADISPLKGLTNLTELFLDYNSISDISPLAGLTNLIILTLGGNSIFDISPLAGLNNLTRLSLDYNSISDISALSGLINLIWLSLLGNSISDLSPLVANTGLGQGDRVLVEGNPLNNASINTHIPALQRRGVRVDFDDLDLTPVDIPDPNLRAVIEKELGKASGDTITADDMATLTQLAARNVDIRVLTGLEAATNLTELLLGFNSIADISPLKGLTNLTELFLDYNSISDISPLAGLTNLIILTLGGNSIFDISPLAGLNNLTRLSLDYNSISDISALSGLINLIWLSLLGNSISDLSPLVANTGLGQGDRVLVEGNPLNNASINTHIPALQRRGVRVDFDDLDLTPVDIPDTNLRAAIEAELGKAPGDTITTDDMANLTRLSALFANISDLTGLEAATNLTELLLADDSIADISPLKGLTNLTELYLSDSSISDISPLAGLNNLTELSLGFNSIFDISPLAGLNNLTELFLADNSIADISPLAGLNNLTELFLANNSISDISPLAGLNNLTRLSLDYNSISDISALSGLINLIWLSLLGNSISDLSPLVANTGLGQGDAIIVNGNPLNNASINTHIPALQRRGVRVDFDDLDLTPVDIPDTNLRAAIEKALGKASGATITTEDIAYLTRLSALFANISDLTGLEAATNLTELFLANNSISDISPLAGLNNLTLLSLDYNPISDISALSGLINLIWLSLLGNSISDLSPLVANTGLGQGDAIIVNGNPLNNASINTHIPALQRRGVRVDFDDPFDKPVDIPDSNLRTAIEKALRKASGVTITTEDMKSLYELEAPNASITDLTGLEHATNLTQLELSDNSISDISPLKGLTNLVRLDLNNNSISDISPLVANTGLGPGNAVLVEGNLLNNASINTHIPTLISRGVRVDFDNPFDKPVDIPDSNLRTAIEKALGKASGVTITTEWMKRLYQLIAPNASITDLTGLEGATKLTWLELHNNFISDISPLKGLTNLRRLELHNNSISDISPLVANTGLGPGDVIIVNGNPLNNASINTHIPTLISRGVRVDFDKLVDIPDSNLRTAIEKALGKASGVTITTEDMKHLPQLIAPNASITDLTGLEGATNLTLLELGNNFISDLSPLKGLTNLVRLELHNNSISDISPLKGLTNLKYLLLDNNSISDISPLKGLTNLVRLELHNNSISDISPLKGLTNLKYLLLDNNSISDISPLKGLTNLRRLELHNNSISDISPLVANTGLGPGDVIIVNGNPLNNASINTHIPTLISRGVRVDFDKLVDIPDSNLRTAIEKALGKASGVTITTEDMANLTVLRALFANISDLTGLEHATNLTELYLSDNSISDISPLAGLNNLAELYLSDNSISDISPLAGLTNLRILGLSGNSISDISPVAGLINLIELSLENNSISDISPLVANAGLGSGDTVSVSENPLNHASINTHIPALQSRGVEVYFDALEPATPEYLLSIPAGISLIHVPLKVTEVDGVAQTIESVADLYDALGGTSAVNFLITYDSQAQEWRSYFGASDKGTPADRVLTDDMGIIAGMTFPRTTRFSGNPLGTNGNSTITVNLGLNLVGLPLNDSRINRVSDLFALDGIGGNVPVIILTDDGEFKAVGRADDPGDIPIVGGQAFILSAQRAETVALSGDGWTNTSGTAAAPPMALTGIEVGDTTPVLGLRGAVVDEKAGLKVDGFRVTVKNLSTGRAVAAVTAPDEAGYRLTVVDIETGRAATIGDTLEISAQSSNPFIGVKPLRYTITAEDVKRSRIQLPELVAYEIPAETQLLVNYPNPFNPETWIPYRLAEDAFVTLTIYDQTGHAVRTLDVGHQIASVYENRSRAIYWDGRNQVGEQVASGVYFYHLSAGDYSATRKMLILK